MTHPKPPSDELLPCKRCKTKGKYVWGSNMGEPIYKECPDCEGVGKVFPEPLQMRDEEIEDVIDDALLEVNEHDVPFRSYQLARKVLNELKEKYPQGIAWSARGEK